MIVVVQLVTALEPSKSKVPASGSPWFRPKAAVLDEVYEIGRGRTARIGSAYSRHGHYFSTDSKVYKIHLKVPSSLSSIIIG